MTSAAAMPSPQTPLQCDNCDSIEDVLWYCRNCEGDMCTKCKETHTTEKRMFRTHQVISRSEAIKFRRREQCPLHPCNNFIMHCDKCLKLVCVTCLSTKHRGHELSEIDDAMMILQSRLAKFRDQLESDLLGKCRYEKEHITKSKTENVKWLDLVMTEIEGRRQELMKHVNEICDQLVIMAAAEKNQNDQVICKSEEEIDNKITEVSQLISRLEDVQALKDTEIIQLTEKIFDVNSFELPSMAPIVSSMFVPGRTILDHLSEQVGKFQEKIPSSELVSEMEPKSKKALSENPQEPKSDVKKDTDAPDILSYKPESSPSPSQGHTAVASLGNIKEPRVTDQPVFVRRDQTGLFFKSLREIEEDLATPKDLKEHRVTDQPVFRQQKQTGLFFKSLREIEEDLRRKRAVTRSVNIVEPCLQVRSVYSLRFQKEQRFDFSVDTIVPVSKDQAWVSESKTKQIRLINENGKILKTINTDFCLDNFDVLTTGELVTVDYRGQCIRKLSITGEVTASIDTPAFYPSGICVCDHGENVAVVMDDEKSAVKLEVYKLDGGQLVLSTHLEMNCSLTQRITSPRYPLISRVAQNKNGDYCIVHSALETVYIIGNKGEVKYIYSRSDDTGVEFSPLDICCDKNNAILVLDKNNGKIHKLDYLDILYLSKNITHTILEMNYHDPFKYFTHFNNQPRGLGIDTEGRLWLGGSKGFLFVLNINKI